MKTLVVSDFSAQKQSPHTMLYSRNKNGSQATTSTLCFSPQVLLCSSGPA
jgi:hypothetical protein